MNSKLIMTICAAFLAVMGIALTFAADDIIITFVAEPTEILRIISQLLGATYFAFAVLNWMAKGAIIGGIYNKPLVMANFAHFFIGGAMLAKTALRNQQLPAGLVILAGIYVVMALLFAFIMFRHPNNRTA
ncbi:hypothetical protein LT679_11900 [Mucilaginibacter roseus]|uniref:DUF4383 domain-containing protein n=1 Tax=Mucilaginibacter roseus TaxID=1528868 RepID=A0ABS8U6Y4_9SPHI|nr:hypothetical protein [Mucilaginibacter roseus]MCD8741308.1 hypothetical protein [Mucilaginibacter roseus]